MFLGGALDAFDKGINIGITKWIFMKKKMLSKEKGSGGESLIEIVHTLSICTYPQWNCFVLYCDVV